MAGGFAAAAATFARDMLTVGDNLRRALDAVPALFAQSRIVLGVSAIGLP